MIAVWGKLDGTCDVCESPKHDSAAGVGEGGRTRSQSTEDEQELDAFMRAHETVLTAADGVRELRRAGGDLVEAFREDPKLVGELLAFCKAVVRACEGHGVLRAHEIGLLGPVISDTKARASRARLATRLACQARGRRERLVGSYNRSLHMSNEGCSGASGPSDGRCGRTGLDGTPSGDCSGPGLACGAEWSVHTCDVSADATSCSGASTHKAGREASCSSTPPAATPASAASMSAAVTLYRAAVTPLSLSSLHADASATRSNILSSPSLSSDGAVLVTLTPREFFSHLMSCEDATPTIQQRAAKLPQRQQPPYEEQDLSPAADSDTCLLSASILCHSPAADSDQQRAAAAAAACSGADGQSAKTAARQVASLFLFVRDWLRYGCVRNQNARVHVRT